MDRPTVRPSDRTIDRHRDRPDEAPCASPAELRARVTRTDEGAVVAAVGEIDPSTAPQFAAVLDEAFRGSTRVVVDLGGVTFIDSAGLAAVFRAAGAERTEAAHPRELVLRRPSPIVRRLLSLSHADQVLVVEDDDTQGKDAQGEDVEGLSQRGARTEPARRATRRTASENHEPAARDQLPGPTGEGR